MNDAYQPPKRILYVTAMGPGSWESYGKRFYDSFKKNILGADLAVWYHDTEAPPVEMARSLDKLSVWTEFKTRFAKDGKSAAETFFAVKPIVLNWHFNNGPLDYDYVVWVDADVEFFFPILQWENEIFKGDVAYLGRKSVPCNEGAFLAFRSGAARELVENWVECYTSGAFQHYRDMRDNFVFDRLMEKQHGLVRNNLSEGLVGLDMWHQSVLGAFSIHYKGPNKDLISDITHMQPERYKQISEIQKMYEARRVVEVGTWVGNRAIQLAENAWSLGWNEFHYVGFDIFEDEIDHVGEGNKKRICSYDQVYGRLQVYREYMKRKGKSFVFELYKGDSQQTVPRWTKAGGVQGNIPMVFIDGGHSEETVRKDYENLRANANVILFDDVMQPEEGAPDGPRRVWESAEGWQKANLKSGDRRVGCTGSISLGLLVAPHLKKPVFSVPLQVTPVDSVPKEEINTNILDNARRMPRWLEQCHPHGGTAILVSGGPSLKKHLKQIKEDVRAGGTVFCVKHAYPKLRAAGIEPHFCVVLDPRPFEGLSTHGEKRSELYANPSKKTTWLVATMTDQETLTHLLGEGARVVGWNAYTQSLQKAKFKELEGKLMIAGGTCSAWRAIMLAFALGFRRYRAYGYDMFYADDVDQGTLAQKLMPIMLSGTGEGRRYLTTGELVAAIQDFKDTIIPFVTSLQLKFEVFGEGPIVDLWEEARRNDPKKYVEWTDYERTLK